MTEGSIKGAELSFTADDARGFILAGERISLLSGSLHYWRVPREYWEERLLALREMGLNTVETYIPWSLHQPRPTLESISFEGNLDLEHFLDLARGLGLMVGGPGSISFRLESPTAWNGCQAQTFPVPPRRSSCALVRTSAAKWTSAGSPAGCLQRVHHFDRQM